LRETRRELHGLVDYIKEKQCDIARGSARWQLECLNFRTKMSDTFSIKGHGNAANLRCEPSQSMRPPQQSCSHPCNTSNQFTFFLNIHPTSFSLCAAARTSYPSPFPFTVSRQAGLDSMYSLMFLRPSMLASQSARSLCSFRASGTMRTMLRIRSMAE